MRVTARIIANQVALSNVLVVARINVQDAPMSVRLLVLTRAETVVGLAAKLLAQLAVLAALI